MPTSKERSQARRVVSRESVELSPRCKRDALWCSIDPGIHTGWALWKGTELIESGVFTVPGSKAHERFETRLMYLCTMLSMQSISMPWGSLVEVHMEGVEHHGSVAGIAAERSGATQKLAYIVGAYLHALGVLTRCYLHKPHEWKGQLSDHAVDRWVEDVMDRGFKRHEVEAVGLGLYLQGRWM